MAITDIFKGKQYKEELAEQKRINQSMQSLLSPEMQDIVRLQQEITNLNSKKVELENIVAGLDSAIKWRRNESYRLDTIIQGKKSQLVQMDTEMIVQEFGLYTPQFAFMNSDEYKSKLDNVRLKQKELIKNNTAVLGNTNWQINGSATAGKKMVADMQKLLLRAFNAECDEAISKVKYSNFDASITRIRKSADAISKLGITMGISINIVYLDLKMQELRLAFEYQQKKQEEKEAQRAARAEMREAAKLQKEIEEQRRKIEKEQTHYQTAYEKILKQLEQSPEDAALLQKKIELEKSLADVDKAMKDIDYREANQRAGYVYIISNIGAFGEDIYKIGMTRRLEPQERIDELGDASVPFNFDVHAMIFSDDAPALEAALHKAFENRKLNMVNTRREFFNVTLDEIKEVVKKNFDKTVEFIDVPDAEQYRVSQKMKNGK